MKTKQLLLIGLLAAVALLAAGLVAVRGMDGEQAGSSGAEQIDLAPFAPADIERFGYTFGGETLEFAKRESLPADSSASASGEAETVWYLTDDPDYPLDQSAVSTMLVALGNLTAQRQIADGGDYGFDTPTLTAWVTAGGETCSWTLGAENTVTGSMYLRVEGQEGTAYLVSVTALSALETTKEELAAPAATPEPTEAPASAAQSAAEPDSESAQPEEQSATSAAQ